VLKDGGFAVSVTLDEDHAQLVYCTEKASVLLQEGKKAVTKCLCVELENQILVSAEMDG